MSDHHIPSANRATPLMLLLSIAAVLAIGVLWLEAQKAEPTATAALPPELKDEPDLYINAATIHQFRADGSRKYLLKADNVNHFDDQSVTRMQAPNLLLDSKQSTRPIAGAGAEASADTSAAPWRATSNIGYVRQRPGPSGASEEVVLLKEDVVLSQTREPPRYLSVRTTSLYLYPDREYVETNDSVTIDTHTGRTKAAGMRGNLTTGVLRLVGDSSSSKATRVQTIVLPFQFK